MNHPSDLQHPPAKLPNILGGRFLERTRNELAVMHSECHAARKGDAMAIEQLLQFAHRIGGAAAMLGFAQVGEPVRSIERILRTGVLSPVEWSEIETYMQQLQMAISEAGESLIT